MTSEELEEHQEINRRQQCLWMELVESLLSKIHNGSDSSSSSGAALGSNLEERKKICKVRIVLLPSYFCP